MSEYIISTSSTADLPKSYVEENGLLYFPFSFDIEGKEYKDNFGQDMSVKDFYARLRQGASSTTSMINRAAFEQGFIPHLEKGTNILHIEFSSALSGTYQNAVSAAQDLNEKYPGKLIVIDSLCASLGQGLFVDYAVQMKKQGKSMQEAMDEVQMVVEGVYSAKAAAKLAKKYDVPMPIVEEVNKVLFEGKSPAEAVDDLMLRESRSEHRALQWEK